MRFSLMAVAAAVVTLMAPAQVSADVVSATPSAFVLRAERVVQAPPDRTWAGLVRVGSWWNAEHSSSRVAHNLSLDPRAGGCWCERWRDGSVEHGRVIMAMSREGVRTLRLAAPLGPLQSMGVTAILTFVVTPDTAGAKILMTYRVSGDPSLGLDQVGPGVNEVMMEQYERLIRFVTSGSPD